MEKIRWTAITSCVQLPLLDPYPMAVFNSLRDALEYASWVMLYDEERFVGCNVEWITYIVEGDFINV